ncbi:MAG: TonB-dependent receptor [Sphingobacteriaceae bacterium]|nr:TonB-dependent receptor [Sphingobacteriaceae bacterium]
MKKYLFLLFNIFLFSTALKAQKTNLYLVDESNKIPIQYAIVQSEDGKFYQISDENGFVSLKKVPKTSHTLSISCVGFQPKSVALSSLSFSKKDTIIYLQSKISTLAEVNIKASSKNGVFKTISDLDIHLRPINNSQEILRMVPGLFIGQHAGGGKAEQIFLRGFDIDHGTDININVDGMPVNMVSHAHGQGYADLHFLIPELIEKVNFNKGPYFAEKGNFTTAGFVEFKTKDYLENNFSKVEIGQFGTYRNITGINLIQPKGNKRNQSLYFAGEGSFSKGFFDNPQNFNRFNGLLKYHGLINKNNSISATISGFKSKWNASGQIPERAVDSGLIGFYGAIDETEGGETERYNANLEWLSRLDNGGFFRHQMYYSKYLFELYSNFTFFKEDPINGDQIRQKENRNLMGLNSMYQNEYHLGSIKTESTFGVQMRYDHSKDVELTRTINRTENNEQIMLGNVQELNTAMYYTQKMNLSSKFDITAALRFDNFNNLYQDLLSQTKTSKNASIWSPKLNLNYRVNNQIELYLYNGKGFHSNDTRVTDKKALPPAYGTDLGGVFKIGKKLFIQTAIWQLWLDQEFVYVGDEGIVEAGGKTQRLGFDFSTRYEMAKNLFADIDFSFAKPKALEVPKAESYLPLAPRFTSVGGLSYRQKNGWNGSLRYRYMADRPANETNTVIAKGYFITDGAINYTAKKWEVGLSIQNLLNSKWKETQFDTESKLKDESEPISEIHFTPGTPFFARFNFTLYF